MPLPKANSSSFFSNSFFIFITRFFPSLANLVVLILYSRQLPMDVYGNYQHFWIQMNLICPLACFGIHVLVITYSKGFIMSILRKITPFHYAVYAFWVLGFSAVFALLQSSALHISFVLPFLFMVSFVLSVIFESLLIVFRSFRSLTSISIIYSLAFCIIHFVALNQGFSMQFLFTALTVLTVLRCLVYAIILKVDIQGNIHELYADTFDVARIRSLWLHLGLYDVLQILFNWIDKFVISLVLIAPLSAIYYNGSQTIPVLPLLLSAASSAVLIQIATGNKNNETANLVALMNHSGRVLSCIVFPVFFYLFLFREDLFTQVFTKKFSAAIPVFAVSVLVLPVKAYSFTTVLQRMHKGNIINIGAIADLLLACVLMYPLYQWLGLPGVALSFVTTTYLQAAFYLFYSAKLLHIPVWQLVPYGNWMLKLIVFASVFIAFRYVADGAITAEIKLFLGGTVMLLMIAGSLFIELRNKKHGNI